jgi:glucokinase
MCSWPRNALQREEDAVFGGQVGVGAARLVQQGLHHLVIVLYQAGHRDLNETVQFRF